MIFARPRPLMQPGFGQPMPQMPMGMQQQIPQMQGAVMQPGMQPGIHPGMQLPPELLARLQQMQGGLGGYGQQAPQMGFGRPTMGIQPLSPASAYSLR